MCGTMHHCHVHTLAVKVLRKGKGGLPTITVLIDQIKNVMIPKFFSKASYVQTIHSGHAPSMNGLQQNNTVLFHCTLRDQNYASF